MADPKKQAATPKKQAATETRQSIARQTAEFLKSGQKIQKIPSGVSGIQGGFSPYKRKTR